MRPSVQRALVGVLLTAAILYGVSLRLVDPLSTKAIAAEDPYTHVVFTKEWGAQGYFADSYYLGTTMYPPGMQAWIIAFQPFTGIPLIDFARFVPIAFGALAILGMYALASRLGGPAAGLAAAFLTAIMPEHAFRSELLFPTAFDLALLPFWMISFDMALKDEPLWGSILFVGTSIPIALMHPWSVPLFAVPLAMYAALRAVRGEIDRGALWRVGAMVVPAVAFALASRWDQSDTGFSGFAAKIPGLAWLGQVHTSPFLLFPLILVIGAVIAAAAIVVLQVWPALPRAVGIALAAGLLALVPILARSPPQDVSYLHMLGMVAIALALAGVLLAALRPTRLGDMGVTLGVWLFPLTAINVFQSAFWPQRTVAYLCIAVALLGGSAIGHLQDLPARFVKSVRAKATVSVAALLACALLVAGAAAAQPAHVYKWYRLYSDEDYQTFDAISGILAKDPHARAFIYTWQPALMVKTLGDPAQVWYGSHFFNEPDTRAKELSQVKGPAYVVVDKYTTRDVPKGKVQTDFVNDSSHYHAILTSPSGDLTLYEVIR